MKAEDEPQSSLHTLEWHFFWSQSSQSLEDAAYHTTFLNSSLKYNKETYKTCNLHLTGFAMNVHTECYKNGFTARNRLLYVELLFDYSQFA